MCAHAGGLPRQAVSVVACALTQDGRMLACMLQHAGVHKETQAQRFLPYCRAYHGSTASFLMALSWQRCLPGVRCISAALSRLLCFSGTQLRRVGVNRGAAVACLPLCFT